ncbi:MAG TPA: hypothetical protein VKS44_12535 [Candidatus Acidoferrales bacterium]|nr:hypothetical protein [Candidatus Acidoferrales bacterium]
MNSKLRIVLVATAILLFGAGAARTTYAAPPTDACSLLTEAQVSTVLGVPAAGRALGPKSCIWVQTGVKPGSTRRRVDLVILIMQGYTGGYAVATMPNAPTSATHVSGLGDDAYYLSMRSGAPTMELRVKKGGVAFGIRVQSDGTPFTPDQIKAKEKTLALEILAKL